MPLTATHATAALRMLLAAWCADNWGLPAQHQAWLLRQLIDPAWHPDPVLCERLAPRFLAWAEHRAIREIAVKALDQLFIAA